MKFNSNGIIQTIDSYESNAILLNNISSFSYIPAKDTMNSCINGAIIDFTNYSDSVNGLQVHLEYDLIYSGFDTSSTAGTFNMYVQGANYKIATSSFVWEGINYIGNNAVNGNTAGLTHIVLSNNSGIRHFSVLITIPGSWFNTYSKSYLGIRTDYSNGTGAIAIKNLKATPYKYYGDPCKIGNDFITTNEIIEY